MLICCKHALEGKQIWLYIITVCRLNHSIAASQNGILRQ